MIGLGIGGGVATGSSVINVKRKGARGDGVTDDTAAIQSALDLGTTIVYFPPGDYLATETIYIQDGQTIVGVPFGNLVQDTDTDLQYSVIKFRPTGSDLVAIKNEASTDGNSIKDMALDLDDETHTGVQFTSTYGNVIDGLMFYGTMNAGVVVHQTYVCDLNRILMNGATVLKYCIYIGECNALTINKFLSQSTLAADVDTTLFGIALYGGIIGANIIEPVLQSLTIGIATHSTGANGVTITNPYSENTICTIRNGDTSLGGPGTLNVIGGTLGYPYSGIQYDERGPVIYNRAGGLFLNGVYFQQATSAGTSTGPWNVLTTNQSGPVSMIGTRQTGSTVDNMKSIPAKVSGAGNTQFILMGDEYGSYSAREFTLKADGAYGGKHYGIRVDDSGTISANEWNPSAITGSVSSLLETAIEAPASVLQ